MSKLTKAQQTARNEAIEQLRKWLKPGDTVNCILRHRSSSGMSRSISLVISHPDGDVMDISYWASKAMNDKIDDKHGGIRIGGCGMDMGFALVYNLGRTLFTEGFGIPGYLPHKQSPGERKRPSSEAEAVEMRSNGYLFSGRNQDDTGWDTDGGYALNYRWL